MKRLWWRFWYLNWKAKIAIVVVLVGALFAGVFYGLPAMAKLQSKDLALPALKFGGPSILLASDGKQMATIAPAETGRALKFDQIPELHNQGHLTAEDRSFYFHDGVDENGLVLAAKSNALTASLGAGGGTIEGQYVRKTYLRQESRVVGKFTRKWWEWQYSYALNREFSKPEILGKYLNTNYYGCGSYGIEDAARTWFGVSAREIDDPKDPLHVARATFLAAIIKAPGDWDDFKPGGKELVYAEALLNRQFYILNGLHDLKLPPGKNHVVSRETIEATKELLKPADGSPSTFKPTCRQTSSGRTSSGDPTIIQYARDWLAAWQTQIAELDGYEGKEAEAQGRSSAEEMLAQGGYTFKMTIDRRVQPLLDDAVNAESPNRNLSFGFVFMNPRNGHVTGMYGGNFGRDPHNNALYTERQPGSTVKAIFLLDAARKGVSMKSEFAAPGFIDIDGPRIWDSSRRPTQGCKITLEDAIAASRNEVFTELAESQMAKNCPDPNSGEKTELEEIDYDERVSKSDVADLIRDMGGEASAVPDRNAPIDIGEEARLAIGDTLNLTPLKMARIASTLQNGGRYDKPVIVLEVISPTGKTVFEHEPESYDVEGIDEEDTQIVNKALTGVYTKGTAQSARIADPLAGKTGSTVQNAWAFAYPAKDPENKAREDVCAGWGGFKDDKRSIDGILGSHHIAQMCSNVYATILRDGRTINFPDPGEKGERIGLNANKDEPPATIEPLPTPTPDPTPTAEPTPEPTTEPEPTPTPEPKPTTPRPTRTTAPPPTTSTPPEESQLPLPSGSADAACCR
jgi:membrane peptidoglycan carboxypeptidase